MNFKTSLLIALFACTSAFAQTPLEQLVNTERQFIRAAAERGQKIAFLEMLADGGILFRPNAINGKQFWNDEKETTPSFMRRKLTVADISSNGIVGYTTGSWELFKKGMTGSPDASGQYATIWEKRPDGKFYITLDVTIKHESFPVAEIERPAGARPSRDNNKKGYSAAEASMNFLKVGMANKALGQAYAKFASNEVRLLREGIPPIVGKKEVIKQTRDYTSMKFPLRLGLLESSDMAYFWNPCEYINSDEGYESGNCLHVLKLKKKTWSIVLGVFARVENNAPPQLRVVKPAKLRTLD